MPVLERWLIISTTFIVGGVGILYLFMKHRYGFWKRKGIPYLEPCFPFGNFKDALMQRVNMNVLAQKFYDDFKDHKYVGLYFLHNPFIMIKDPEIIRTILVKDFHHFEEHSVFVNEEADPLQAKSLFSLDAKRWRDMRMKLTPTFTSGKMKRMFNLVCSSAEDLVKFLEPLANEERLFEVKDMMAKYTTDVIGSCAFGINTNSLKDTDSEFRKMGKVFMDPPGLFRLIKMWFMILLPEFSKSLGLSFTPKSVTEFFRSTMKETIQYREKNHVVRNDFVDLLIQLKKRGKVESDESDEELEISVQEDSKQVLTHDDLTAQAMIFFIGGFETSSILLTFLLYELALNPEVQKRLQEDVDAALKENDGKFTYEAVIHNMPYLDCVVAETLRKYPPLPATDRICTREYTLPGTDVKLEKGAGIHVPIMGFHYDPVYYPDPEKFDPERFNEDNKRKRPNYTYLPFGEGPRMCIGQRFAMMQTKVGVAHFLSKYTVQRCPKTLVPMEFDASNFFLAAKGGMWLQIKHRKTPQYVLTISLEPV